MKVSNNKYTMNAELLERITFTYFNEQLIVCIMQNQYTHV